MERTTISLPTILKGKIHRVKYILSQDENLSMYLTADWKVIDYLLTSFLKDKEQKKKIFSLP